ncbi:zinc-finger protein [Tieghemiomyces parasiticus]|uniref:Zinc-finger protein n=1 Tax=Tieghemiomyces parasiticus TaxID=78921 RepID=A0A9W7ZR40_9FUNG|nr:zinc-finger protein [Tieghemiomyces parasiticus]
MTAQHPHRTLPPMSPQRYPDHFPPAMSSPASDSFHDLSHPYSSDSESTYSTSYRSLSHRFTRPPSSGRHSDLDMILNPVAEEPLSASFNEHSFFDSPHVSSRELTPLPEEATDHDDSMMADGETSPHPPSSGGAPFGYSSIGSASSVTQLPPLSSPRLMRSHPAPLLPPPNFFSQYGVMDSLTAAAAAVSAADVRSPTAMYTSRSSGPAPVPIPGASRAMATDDELPMRTHDRAYSRSNPHTHYEPYPARPTYGSVDAGASTITSELASHCRWSTCAAVFRSMDELTRHLYKLHVSGRNQGFMCKWASCHTEKGDTDELIQHVCSDHLGQTELRHACGWVNCQAEFRSFDDLTAHLSNDHVGAGRSQYFCSWMECSRAGKPFSQRQRAMRHIQTHTGDKPYQCTTCGKRFSESHIMGQHMRIHTGEKPYKCPTPECGRTFTVSSALTIHIRTHTGEKPFKCKYDGCDKRFAESSNLTKHMRVHTGERPFRCPNESCSKKFSRPDQVARHQKTHNPPPSS